MNILGEFNDNALLCVQAGANLAHRHLVEWAKANPDKLVELVVENVPAEEVAKPAN